MRVVLWFFGAVIIALTVGFATQVIFANKAAPEVFGKDFCWLRQGPDVINIKELEFTPVQAFLPNPFQQLNRRYVGIGIDDPEVRSPHFAIMKITEDGPRIAAWSYRDIAFWQGYEGLLDVFVSAETRDACRRYVETGAVDDLSS